MVAACCLERLLELAPHLQRHAVRAVARRHEEAEHDLVRVDAPRVSHVDVVEDGGGAESGGDVADDSSRGLREEGRGLIVSEAQYHGQVTAHM